MPFTAANNRLVRGCRLEEHLFCAMHHGERSQWVGCLPEHAAAAAVEP